MEIGDWGGWTGAVLGLVAIAVTIAIYLRQRDRRTIDFIVRSNQPIISATAKPVAGTVTVRANNRNLNEPRIIIITIVNTGSKSVAAANYTQPITIHCENVTPDAADVFAERPAAGIAGAAVKHTSGDVTVTPALFNPGDSFSVQLITDGRPDNVVVSARFADQSRAMKRLKLNFGPASPMFFWAALSFVTLVICASVSQQYIDASRTLVFIWLGGVTLGFIFAAAKAVQIYRRRKLLISG